MEISGNWIIVFRSDKEKNNFLTYRLKIRIILCLHIDNYVTGRVYLRGFRYLHFDDRVAASEWLCINSHLTDILESPPKTLTSSWMVLPCFLGTDPYLCALAFLLSECTQSMWDLSSLTRARIHTLCMRRWNLNYWTTGKFLFAFLIADTLLWPLQPLWTIQDPELHA